MEPTAQQQLVIAHDPAQHARVIAGPGTGKSFTAIALLRKLHDADPDTKLGLLTFTRAATGELTKKVGAQGLDWLNPSTVHAFALRLLLQNATQSGFPLPLRIPDSWETKELIHRDLARRLRNDGFKVDSRGIARLESEMAAQWESLDTNLVLLADIDPGLRNAYVGQWREHRRKFGYMLIAEIPFRAGDLTEDFSPDLEGLSFLVVDEYQDLNRADIRLVRLLAAKGVRIVAIGDDDQSIYGFRMAAPVGISEFPIAFPGAIDYPLTISMRCGTAIIDAATTLIETAPNRVRRPRLTARVGASDGEFAYLRFANQTSEARGVASLIDQRRSAGVAERDIAVLVRSNIGTWVSLLQPELEARGIRVVDTSWVERALADPPLRMALASARLALNREDSLAWWTLLHLTRGISSAFFEYVDAASSPETFGETLLRLFPMFPGAPSTRTAEVARNLIEEQLLAIQGIDFQGVVLGETGWGGWLAQRITSGTLSPEATQLLEQVGRSVPPEGGLANFLGQLEPIGKDLATQADAVRIMSMASSKGLTVDSVFVMGVEAGIIPHPRADLNEERRLLYVAMTRATDLTVLTFASRRTGPTARHGAPNVNQPRGRCPLFESLPIGAWVDGDSYVQARVGAAGAVR